MIVLDTNIVIHLFNGNKTIAEKLNDYSPREIMISFVTLGELLFGACHSKQAEKNLLKATRFATTIEVIHSNQEIALIYGRLKNESFKAGVFPGDHDLWIAATALKEKAHLVTHNVKHFRWIEGLTVENWLQT